MSDESNIETPDIETADVEDVAEDGYEASESEDPSTTEELEAAVDDAIENGASEEEVKNMIKKFELKVNGKTITKEIDLSDERTLTQQLQLAEAGRQSMQQLAELKKLYGEEINRLKTDPFAVLQELGLDPDDLSYNYLQKKLEESQKSPEQLEAEAREKELQELREEKKRLEQEKIQAEQMRVRQEAMQNLDNEIADALDEYQHLPKTPKVVKHIASVMLWALSQDDLKNITVKDCLPIVEKEINDEINELIENLPEQYLEKFFSKKAMERMRKNRVEQVKKQPKTVANLKPQSPAKSAKTQEKKKISLEDFLRM
jgi:hypothetical protein